MLFLYIAYAAMVVMLICCIAMRREINALRTRNIVYWTKIELSRLLTPQFDVNEIKTNRKLSAIEITAPSKKLVVRLEFEWKWFESRIRLFTWPRGGNMRSSGASLSISKLAKAIEGAIQAAAEFYEPPAA